MVAIHHPWVFAFGLLGNFISFMVFLAPLPTFIRIYKKKTTEGFKSLPYVVAIFSCMLWIYYALLKGNSILLITINGAGVFIESIYVGVFLIYAPKKAKISTLRLLLLMNFGGFCAIVLLCQYLVKGSARLQVFGWICVVFSISVFAAPLSVMRLIIRTKSVEFMPFNLSLCLTLTAIIWFMFGLLQKDIYVALPNVVGFVFGVAQMTMYAIYRKYDQQAKKQKLPEQVQVSSPVKQSNVEINSINSSTNSIPNDEIEVVVGNSDIEEGNDVHLHGLPCNMDSSKIIVDGPTPPAIQLVQCSV